MRRVCLALVFAATLPLLADQPTDQSPTKEQTAILEQFYGWGKDAILARKNSKIYEVKSFKDHGEGTLRDALEREGSFWIVFKEDGEIDLDTPIDVKSNKTVDARGRRVVIDTNTTRDEKDCADKNAGKNITGFVINKRHSIVLLNLIFDDNYAPLGQDCEGSDAIAITDSKHIWIHHCTFKAWADGAVDILSKKEMSSETTVSWSKFHKVYQANLWKVRNGSFHHNVCDDVGFRCPNAEKMNENNRASVHSYNNYITKWATKGIMSADASALWDDHNILEPGEEKHVYALDEGGCIERQGGKTYGDVVYTDTKGCEISQPFKDAAIKTSGDRQTCASENNDCWKTLKNQLTDEHKGAGATLPKP